MEQSQNKTESRVRSLSGAKQVLFSIIIITSAFIALEIVVRVGAFFIYGQSPYFLLYGISSAMGDDNPEGHSSVHKGYFKFPPSRVLHQYGLFEKPTPIRINSLGFRGKDFKREKPDDTIRIVCLGESSTFGFYDRDDYTYPAILERLLEQKIGSARVEVINAGIPHADSDNILAMLKEEVISYQPDVITIYAGFNDAGQVMDASTVEQALRWLHGHLASYVALKRVISALGGPELYSKWAVYGGGKGSQTAYVKRQVDLHLDRFERNVREILAVADANHIRVVVMKQALNIINNQKKRHAVSLNYKGQVAEVAHRVHKSEAILANEVVLLVHSALMDRLGVIAHEKYLPIVDNIAIADEHPEYFASYVHLTEEGNQALAAAIAPTIVLVISQKTSSQVIPVSKN
jgi:lysophospholipase L1-like esterase